MALRKGVPYRHSPTTVCDTLDETETQPGGMALLQNLIPDPTTQNLWVPRPAATVLTSFAGFSAPSFVSVQITVGSLIVGMIATTRFVGKDEPFVYNIASASFATVSGVTASNVPNSPQVVGAWTPPTMDIVGKYVVITHPGYDGVTNFVGWIDISTPSAPVYSAGNTSGTALPSVPVAVAQYTGRAYYICNPVGAIPAAIATDVLDPTKRTNGTYVLTFGNNLPLTALKGLPLNTTLGGVVQSLMVFQGATNIVQISGDFASTGSGSISQNALNVSTGTLAPNSVVSTPSGLMFMSPEGMRLISFNAQVSDPIGIAGSGIIVPFSNAVVPSRVTAACNAKVVRISVQNGYALGTPQQEWWYDLTRKVWSGPHTFPASTISVYNNTFIMTPIGMYGSLWQSDAAPNSTTTYTENGAAMIWQYQTALLSSRGDLEECAFMRGILYLGYAPGNALVTVVVNDENGAQLGATQLALTAGSSTSWGSATWGTSTWAGLPTSMGPRSLDFKAPIVFDRAYLRAQGTSGAGVRLGDCYFKYQPLRYAARP